MFEMPAMSAEALTAPPTSQRRPQLRRLSGHAEPGRDELTVALVTQTQRRRRATAGTALAKVRALAGDPHLYELAAVVTAGNQRDYSVGGRPLHYPDWCLLLFGGCIRVFGSASGTARALQDPVVWQQVRKLQCPSSVTRPWGPCVQPARPETTGPTSASDA